MKTFYTLLIVGIATFLLVTGGVFTNQIPFRIHPNSFIDGLAKYQFLALTIAITTTTAILFLNPESKQFLKAGKLITIAEKEKWLGINGESSWIANGFQLLVFISSATGLFMFLGLNYTNSLDNFQWNFIPVVLLFSLSNSFTEELIFRFGIVGGLSRRCSKLPLLIISAVLFGLPHYWGNPGGFTGVLMSGLLGYILSKATIETKGIGVAWIIHFVQDIIIFTALIMMNVT
jgi:membrane protease YdiL (CAAX protease family)